jgi:hypothetical protein
MLFQQGLKTYAVGLVLLRITKEHIVWVMMALFLLVISECRDRNSNIKSELGTILPPWGFDIYNL